MAPHAEKVLESRPSQPLLRYVLTFLKATRPDLFRQELRISPSTFDLLIDSIADDPIFSDDSNDSQLPVEQQLAIALYRFGRHANVSGLQKVAHWAGVDQSQVNLATRRVLIAVTRREFRLRYIRLPTQEEKNEAKAWVGAHSCRAWRHGWCFVDGTLIPLSTRPHWYGESYFDRRRQYSLNIQVSTFI